MYVKLYSFSIGFFLNEPPTNSLKLISGMFKVELDKE